MIPLLQFLRDKGRAPQFRNARPNSEHLSSQGCREQHISCIPFTPSYSVSYAKDTRNNTVISSRQPGYRAGKSHTRLKNSGARGALGAPRSRAAAHDPFRCRVSDLRHHLEQRGGNRTRPCRAPRQIPPLCVPSCPCRWGHCRRAVAFPRAEGAFAAVRQRSASTTEP